MPFAMSRLAATRASFFDASAITHVEIIQKRYLCFREKDDEVLAICTDDLDRGPFFQLLPMVRRVPGYRQNVLGS